MAPFWILYRLTTSTIKNQLSHYLFSVQADIILNVCIQCVCLSMEQVRETFIIGFRKRKQWYDNKVFGDFCKNYISSKLVQDAWFSYRFFYKIIGS